VIDTPETSLYKLFSESAVQVGVFSTALYEGLSFGLQTYLLDAPGVEYLDPLVNTGNVQKVKTAEELKEILHLQETSTPFDSEYFFQSNAVSNIVRFLNDLRTMSHSEASE
jgi:hypothetical protein